jgi:hypothetical protein
MATGDWSADTRIGIVWSGTAFLAGKSTGPGEVEPAPPDAPASLPLGPEALRPEGSTSD